jgi:hypothetical protein
MVAAKLTSHLPSAAKGKGKKGEKKEKKTTENKKKTTENK